MIVNHRQTSVQRSSHAPFIVGACCAIVTLGLVVMLTSMAGSAFATSPYLLSGIGLLTLLPIVLNVSVLGIPFVSATNFYLLMVWCFHMGLVLPGSLGISSHPLSTLGGPQALMVGALCTVLAFSACQAGVCLTQFVRLHRALPAPAARQPARRDRQLFRIGMTGCAVLVAAALWDLRTIGISTFLTLAYNSDLYQTADLRIYKTALSMTGTMILIALTGTSTRSQRRIALFAAGALVAYLAMVGDRGYAFMFTLAFAFAWRSLGYAISRRTLVAAALCCVIAAPTIRLARALEASERSFQETLKDADYLGTLEEMGSSFKTLAGTVTLVPEEQPYRLGGSYVAAASYVLPNLGSELGRGFKRLEQLDPALWITAVMEPATYAVGGGLGYSAIAEPYLNFGFVGVAVFFAIAGALLAASDVRVPGTATGMTIAVRAVVLYPLLVTARNDMTNFVRPAMWGLLILVFIACLPVTARYAVRLRAGVREQIA